MQESKLVRDKIEELPESLRPHLIRFIENRVKEISALKNSFVDRDEEKILKWTHAVLGMADSYKLFELTGFVSVLDNKIREKDENFILIDSYNDIKSYLLKTLSKIN